ncbi:MAG: hypothetical protein HYZ38_00030 [Mycobacterium sp.]|nr:hypothetical protein [Mycobacterium sp.]
MSLLGDWDVTIKTPIGSLAVDYSFTGTDDGIVGTATYNDDTVSLQNIAFDGDRATWQQKVTKPMRLNLSFDVIVTGDGLNGHSRAGRLPRSTVVGQRRR